MFRGWRCILIAFASLMIGVGAASALTTVTVKRCGYAAKGFYGKDAIYPWHMSCAQARTILAGAINPHAKHINLTADGAATGDAGPVPLTATGGCAAVVWGSASAAIHTARPSSQGPAAEPLGRVPSQKSPTTTLARPGAPAVPEMLSICRTERHCAGDRSPKPRTVHQPDRGKSRWLGTPGSSRAGEPGQERGTFATN